MNRTDEEILQGTVLEFEYAKRNRSGNNIPAKFVVEGTVAGVEETFELTIYPLGEREGGQDPPWDKDSKLPEYMDGLPEDLVGVNIQTLGRYLKEYNGVRQFGPSKKQGHKITVLGSSPGPKAATPAAPAAAPAQAPAPPSIDQNQMRIMRQSTLHYASILVAPIVKDFDTPRLMVERTIQIAGKLLEYVISGEMPLEDDNTTLEEDDFGSL